MLWASLCSSPCLWCWTLCGRCGALEPASMTTSTPVPWRRGSTRWKTSSLSTSLWSQACRRASSCSWPTYSGENTETPLTEAKHTLHVVFFFAGHVTLQSSFHPDAVQSDNVDHVTEDHQIWDWRSSMLSNGCYIPNEVRSTDGKPNQATKLHKDSENWSDNFQVVCAWSVCPSVCLCVLDVKQPWVILIQIITAS